MIQWTWVDSSVIRRIGYDPQSRELGIDFLETGDVYIYSEVQPEEYEEFMEAESKGKYLNTVFKQKNHPCRIVKRGQKPAV